ncbi:hypothetical protein C8R45DRAFT_1217526, partial [Mycena sanguinolenta]
MPDLIRHIDRVILPFILFLDACWCFGWWTPAFTYGLRGLVYYKITVSGPGSVPCLPSSRVFGCTVHEPLTDLVSSWPDGTILVPGVDDMVSIADAEERERLVPSQTVQPLVACYLESEFAKLGSKNTIPRHRQIELRSGKPWVVDWKHRNYAAAIKATESIYARTPDLTREGGFISVTLTFAEQLGVNALLLPMGRGDDGAHSTNETLDKSNFTQGVSFLFVLIRFVLRFPFGVSVWCYTSTSCTLSLLLFCVRSRARPGRKREWTNEQKQGSYHCWRRREGNPNDVWCTCTFLVCCSGQVPSSAASISLVVLYAASALWIQTAA